MLYDRIEAVKKAIYTTLGRDITAAEENFLAIWLTKDEVTEAQALTEFYNYLARTMYAWFVSLPHVLAAFPKLMQYGNFTAKQGWSTYPAVTYRINAVNEPMKIYVLGLQSKQIERSDVATCINDGGKDVHAHIVLGPGVNWQTATDPRYVWAHPFGAHWQEFVKPELLDEAKFKDEHDIKRDLRVIKYRVLPVRI